MESGKIMEEQEPAIVNQSGPTLPGYLILTPLGEGGMGKVYLAEDKALGRKVAIKLISERFVSTVESGARFRREAHIMATVEHPNIVRIYSLGEIENKIFLVMEYVEGEVLSTRIERQGKLLWREALSITRQVAVALEAAWEKQIVHRDVKPSNILLDKHNQVRVADFGLARPIQINGGDTLTNEGSILGTPHYVSPEQAFGKSIDFRTDIYSLGIVLYEMLAGQKPFKGDSPVAIVDQQVHSSLPSLHSIREDLPDSLIELVNWMTEKDATKRPHSYQELLQAIDKIFEHPLEKSFSPVAAKVWLTKALIIAAIILVLSGIWIIREKEFKKVSTQTAIQEQRLFVAVTPFYGPDQDSAKEGRLIASLVEKEIRGRLGTQVRIAGIEETAQPLHDQNAARQLGQHLGANAVVWGEAYALRGETEIQPYLTLIPVRRNPSRWQRANPEEDPLSALMNKNFHPVVVKAEAPNQIELRKTSAVGIGDVVLFLAGMHALYVTEDSEKALALFRQVPTSAQSLYYQAQSLFNLDREAEARTALQQAFTLDPHDSQLLATLGDLKLRDGMLSDAAALYLKATEGEKQFTARQGVVYRGQFYVAETFRSQKYTGGQLLPTSYLLKVDPATDHVLERHHLPGAATSFNWKSDMVQIGYDSEFVDSGVEGHAVLSADDKQWPVSLEPNLSLRILSIQSALAVASNFMSDLDAQENFGIAKFDSHPTILFEDSPKDIQSLEVELRKRMEIDPTQPWYLFLLGETLWSLNKKAEAELIWQRIFSEKFFAIPYYDFATMAGYFESFNQRSWADKAYQTAFQRRKPIQQPLQNISLVERLVNANFIRQVASMNPEIPDLKRRYLWFQRGRELTGICPEGDDFAAAAWQKYFRRIGDASSATVETNNYKKAQQHPFNLITAATLLDYAFYLLIATTLSILVLIVSIFMKSLGAADSYPAKPKSGLSKFIFAFLAATVALIYWWAIIPKIEDWWEFYMFFTTLFILLIVYMSIKKIQWKDMVAAIRSDERYALLIGFLLFVGALSISIFFNYRVQFLSTLPPHSLDAAVNPLLVRSMEDRIRVIDNSSVRYAAAVANHTAGNLERASELYKLLPDDPRAIENLAALKNGVLVPPNSLTVNDLYSAYVGLSWTQWLKLIWQPGRSLNIFLAEEDRESVGRDDLFSCLFQIVVVVCVLLFLAFWWIPAQRFRHLFDQKIQKPSSRSIGSWLLPGLTEFQQGSAVIGYVILILFLFACSAPVLLLLLPKRIPVQGVVTLLQMPNYFNSVPFPNPAEAVPLESYHYWTMFWAFAYSKIFWTMIALAALTAIGLHVFSLQRAKKSSF